MGFFDFFRRKQAPVQPEFKERRLIPRWKLAAPATLTFDADATVIPCTLIDLNLKGFAISTGGVLSQECKSLKLEVQGRYVYNVEVIFVWHMEKDTLHYYGFWFSRLRDSDREKMLAMMKSDFPSYMNLR
ncbi:MAG TPA: PilZ domain-containing protein [Candidatus Omnitrophota bacterium]|nr:PilZ domain-containing protein [Candidatus Omnitrophota bacterium]HPT06845.1 PilZ domain-containing protein [Candidatus Omnitrophota bacterium]